MSIQAPVRLHPVILAGVVAALLAGVVARFSGLGAAPLDVDEYYFTRSIDNVLRGGWPAFGCGGYYTRGLLLQYLAAAGRIGGLSPELAPRLIATIGSLLAIWAAYLLARRAYGRTVGLLTVVVLAVSVWDIEMARFGRMYAPFQAVATWYLVYFLRYTVDLDRKALWPMLTLSILSPLVWEGGVLLLLANLLPPFIQCRTRESTRRDWVYGVGAAAAVGIGYWFVAADFRGYNAESWPAGFTESLTESSIDTLTAGTSLVSQLRLHATWSLLAILPALSMLFALRWVWSWRSHYLTVAGLLSALAATLLHQFAATAAIMLLLLLMRFMTWKELFNRSAAPFHVSLVLIALFWIAFGAATVDWNRPDAGGAARQTAALIYQFVNFPDFVGLVVRPWSRAVPHLGIALAILVGCALLRQAKDQNDAGNYERVLLIVFLVLLLAASASGPPRLETRYVFFLYPAALLIAFGVLWRAAKRLTKAPAAAAATTAVVALGGFALTEDFQPHHLLNINSPAETFRLEMAPGMTAHLVIRDNVRALANWLEQRVATDTDLVINGVHGVDYYYPQVDYFYVNLRDPNFPQWSCQHGTVERWGSYPLLYTIDSLRDKISTSRYTYLVIFKPDEALVVERLAQFQPTVAWTQGYISVISARGLR